MTDNRTTELREKLTERGVEWTAYEKELHLTLKDFYDTRWNAHGVRWSYLEINGVATLSPVGRVEIELTPEQAITATLGSEPPKKCSTCQYRYCVGHRPSPSFGYRCGFGDGKNLCGSNTSVLNHMCCEYWEKELR